MKNILFLAATAITLSACAGAQKLHSADACSRAIDLAYQELNFAKSNGFAGTVEYTKALSLLTAAKTQQTFEAYDGCVSKSEKARYYIKQSQKP